MKPFLQWLQEKQEYTPWGVPKSAGPGSSDLPDAALEQKRRDRRVGQVMQYVSQLDNIELRMLREKLAQYAPQPVGRVA